MGTGFLSPVSLLFPIYIYNPKCQQVDMFCLPLALTLVSLSYSCSMTAEAMFLRNVIWLSIVCKLLFPKATRGFEPISYRGTPMSTLLHATVYMFLHNLLNILTVLTECTNLNSYTSNFRQLIPGQRHLMGRFNTVTKAKIICLCPRVDLLSSL
jgi:hypothetical protein